MWSVAPTLFLLVVSSVTFPARSLVAAESLLQPTDKTQSEYLVFLRKFNDRFCTSPSQREFDQLAKRARSVGNYIPEDINGDIDVKAIRKGLKKLDQKFNWMVQVREKLNDQKKWPDRRKIFVPLSESLERLLKIKEDHFLKGNNSSVLRRQSKDELMNLRKNFDALMGQLYFLTSYDYPVDHLGQRAAYEENKGRRSKGEVKRANEIMFERKLQEDGTFDADQKNGDMYLRTTLNTLALALKGDAVWLDENIRHDLEWAIREMGRQLAWGRSRHIKRIQIWINRVDQQRKFYLKLLNDKDGQLERKQFVDSREANKQLKDFVYRKNAEVYKYLLQQSELMQAFYVFDQILLHEVGNATLYNFRDRQDVAQVVINSRLHPDFSVIHRKEGLYPYLVDLGVSKDQLKTSSWLNVMFKQLRFSFTLYYIPAVRHIFCPDFYRTASVTRQKNLHLISEALRNPRTDFSALKYFSRWSMVGRIDMSKVWKDFKPLPERVGARYEDDAQLKRALVGGKYRYLYTFTDPSGSKYHAVEIGRKTYALRGSIEKPDFFAYRDPHKFRFFEER